MSVPVFRSLSLLRLFVALSAAVLGIGALVLASTIAGEDRERVIEDTEAMLGQYMEAVVGSEVVTAADDVVPRRDLARPVERALERHPELVSAKVWRADGTLAWASTGEDRIGRVFPVEGKLGEVIRHGRSVGEFEELGHGHGAEDGVEAKLGSEDVFEVYMPMQAADGGVIGAYEVYVKAGRLESEIAERERKIWAVTAAVFLALWLVLILLVRQASRTLRRQTRMLEERSQELAASYERLEESSLEAIESLNATVDARDAYTAGHSLRVQRIALAIAHELDLAPAELDALRWGALFHDIGKIGIADAILSKPARLTREEYEEIKRHPAEGAKIVEKLGRLRGAVPVIRHHHERWDGKGYPDGLGGEQIPLGAAIAGLSDAWDAMTTDRPYQAAMDTGEALSEVLRGRATQFSPAVVDAFLEALQKNPTLFEAPGGEAFEAVAGGAERAPAA